MELKSLIGLAAMVVALAGCSSTPSSEDHRPIQRRTFAFLKPGPSRAPISTDTRPAVHGLRQDAITKNLAFRGITKAEAGADLRVGWWM